MDSTNALILAGLGATGLYAIGKEVVAHKRAIRGGEAPTHVPAEYATTVAEDLIAFTASMVLLGVMIDQAPTLFQQAAAMVPQ